MNRIKKVIDNKKVDRVIEELKKVYSTIPGTKGCMDHINLPRNDGGCGGWCCLRQNPQVLYSEFLNTWKFILQNWETENIVNLIKLSLEKYLSKDTVKGCIFFDKESHLCQQHRTRSFNCRLYGVVPEKDFQRKLERLRSEYNDDAGLLFRDQCKLVSTHNGKEVTQENYDKWWNKLKKVENLLDIEDKEIIDSPEGSYLSYHDHLLLQILPIDTMVELTQIRMFGDDKDKQLAIDSLIEQIYKNITRTMDKNGNKKS